MQVKPFCVLLTAKNNNLNLKYTHFFWLQQLFQLPFFQQSAIAECLEFDLPLSNGTKYLRCGFNEIMPQLY